MKTIIICLIFVCILSNKLYCIHHYYFNINGGYLYHLKDDIDGNWQLGGPSEIKSKSSFSYCFGVGFNYSPSYLFEYGVDFSCSIQNSKINNAILKDIRGINNLNDTLPIYTTASSNFQSFYFIISPKVSYKLAGGCSILLKPQFLFNLSSEIKNTYSLSNTNFTKFIGKPEIKKDNNNQIINNLTISPNEISKFNINCILTLEFECFHFPSLSDFDGDPCYHFPTILTFNLDFLIGLSPINNNFIMYPGLSFQFKFPIFKKKQEKKHEDGFSSPG